MIGHISPLDTSTQAMNPMGPLTSSAPADAPVGGATPLMSSSFADAISALQINTAVGQLLQGIGGGAESNKTLQMLIALLILVTLLQGSQSQDSAAGKLGDLAQGGIGRGGYVGMSMSSTTVTIEQTSVVYTGNPAQELGAADAGPDQGQELDVAA